MIMVVLTAGWVGGNLEGHWGEVSAKEREMDTERDRGEMCKPYHGLGEYSILIGWRGAHYFSITFMAIRDRNISSLITGSKLLLPLKKKVFDSTVEIASIATVIQNEQKYGEIWRNIENTKRQSIM